MPSLPYVPVGPIIKRSRAFTLIELLVTVTIIGILASLATINFTLARERSRDTNRRNTLDAYQTSIEQYFSVRHTYFIYSEREKGCDGSGGCPPGSYTTPLPGQNPPQFITCGGPGCVGKSGGSWGMFTREGLSDYNSANNSGMSIADALRSDGFISEVRTDPRTNRLDDDPRLGPSDQFDDFVYTICDKNGQPPANPVLAVSYGLYANLELPTETDILNASHYCGGPNTPGGWNTVATARVPSSSVAQIPGVGVAQAATSSPAASTSVSSADSPIPTVHLSGLQASYHAQSGQAVGMITGSFKAENPSALSVSNIFITINLQEELEKGGIDIVAKEQLPESIGFRPNEVQTFSFTLAVPANLVPGRYIVSPVAFTETGIPIGVTGGSVKVENPLLTGRFLQIDPNGSYVDSGSAQVGPLSGPNLNPGQAPILGIAIANPHSVTVSAIPQVDVYQRTNIPGVAPLATYKENAVTLAPNSTQLVRLTLPGTTIPDTYLAEVRFTDETGQPIAGTLDFRWVVKGESGKILALEANGTQYLTRTVLATSLSVVGPADGTTITGPTVVKLQVAGADHPEHLLYQGSQTLNNLGSQPYKISFPVSFRSGLANLSQVSVTAQLYGSKGQLLHQSHSTVPLVLSRPDLRWLGVGFGGLILILGIGLFSYLRRRRTRATPVVVAGLVLVLTLPAFLGVWGIGTARADTSCSQTGDPGTCGTAWISPPPSFSYTLNAGSTTSNCATDSQGNTTCDNDTMVLTATADVNYSCSNVVSQEEWDINYTANGCGTSITAQIPSNSSSYTNALSIPINGNGTGSLTQSLHGTLTTNCWDCTGNLSQSATVSCVTTRATSSPAPTFSPSSSPSPSPTSSPSFPSSPSPTTSPTTSPTASSSPSPSTSPSTSPSFSPSFTPSTSPSTSPSASSSTNPSPSSSSAPSPTDSGPGGVTTFDTILNYAVGNPRY